MSLSKAFKSIFLWAFILVLSISFIAYFGLTGDTIGGPAAQSSIGKVDGRAVQGDRNSYYYDILTELSSYYTSLGYSMSSQTQELIARQAFYEVATQIVIEEMIEEAGLDVSAEQIIEYLKNEYFSGNIESWNEFVKMTDTARQKGIQVKARKRFLRKMYEQSVFYGMPSSHSRLVHYIDIAKIVKGALVAKYDGASEFEKRITQETLKAYFNENIARYTGELPLEEAVKEEQGNLAVADVVSNKETVKTTEKIANGELPKFEDVYDKVYNDYLLENRANLQASISEEITAEITAVVTKINSSTNDSLQNKLEVFVNEFDTPKYSLHRTEPLSFFSREVAFANNSAEPLEKDAVFTLMAATAGKTGFTQGANSDFYAFIITGEEVVSRTPDEKLYLYYVSQQDSNYYQMLRQQFYTQIFAGRTLEFAGSLVEF